MIIVWVLSWWYGSGWKARVTGLKEQLASTYDYFSINVLAATLFSPYRQISAGNVSGSIAVRARAFFDRSFSRVFGAVVRSMFIVIGIVWLSVQAALGALGVVVWGFVPFLPLVGFVMAVSGWVPSWN